MVFLTPLLNAMLNGTSVILLPGGYAAIRQGKIALRIHDFRICGVLRVLGFLFDLSLPRRPRPRFKGRDGFAPSISCC
jgi:hypothetical protein